MVPSSAPTHEAGAVVTEEGAQQSTAAVKL